MKSQKVVELAKRSLNDVTAWSQIMSAVDGSEDLDYLYAIVAGIPCEDDGSLGMATLMYAGDRMARLFAPRVLAAKTNRDQEILMGLTVKYFRNRLAAVRLADVLKSEGERHNSQGKSRVVLLLITAIALLLHSGTDLDMYLSYLDEGGR